MCAKCGRKLIIKNAKLKMKRIKGTAKAYEASGNRGTGEQ
jgi:hypothetical protein